MKANRLSFCDSVKDTLAGMNVDCTRVLDSCNAALARASSGKVTVKAGNVSLQKETFGFTETESTRFTGNREIGSDFMAFNDAIATVEKRHGAMPGLPIPSRYHAWLQKHQKQADKKAA